MSKVNTITMLISGKQGSGKTTLAKNLCKQVVMHSSAINLQYLKFADPLYAMQDAIRDVLRDEFYTEIATPDGPLLQVLGTEWGRRKDVNFWVGIMRNRIGYKMKEAQHFASKGIPTLFLIDDARFPNELDTFAIPKGEIGHKLLKIRLEAQEHVRQVRAEKWRPATDHPSEVALDGRGDWDKIIYTDMHSADETLELVWKLVLDGFATPQV